jgi:hypothetical protein
MTGVKACLLSDIFCLLADVQIFCLPRYILAVPLICAYTCTRTCSNVYNINTYLSAYIFTSYLFLIFTFRFTNLYIFYIFTVYCYLYVLYLLFSLNIHLSDHCIIHFRCLSCLLHSQF